MDGRVHDPARIVDPALTRRCLRARRAARSRCRSNPAPSHPIRPRVPRRPEVSRGPFLAAAIPLLLAVVALLASLVASPAVAAAAVRARGRRATRPVFFAADGLRQDIVAKYADAGPPAHDGARSSRTAPYAAGNGLLTQAPPNTGAGWYSLATGAWPAVTGSTNNTFHRQRHAVHQPDGGLRRQRPPGRVHRPERGARRPQGRPGRVGRRARTRRPRAPPSTTDVPVGPRRRDQLHRHRW